MFVHLQKSEDFRFLFVSKVTEIKTIRFWSEAFYCACGVSWFLDSTWIVCEPISNPEINCKIEPTSRTHVRTLLNTIIKDRLEHQAGFWVVFRYCFHMFSWIPFIRPLLRGRGGIIARAKSRWAVLRVFLQREFQERIHGGTDVACIRLVVRGKPHIRKIHALFVASALLAVARLAG